VLFRRVPVGEGAAAEVCFTDRHDGDFANSRADADLEPLRQAIFEGRWTWLKQVHGDNIVHVAEPGQSAGAEADGAVSSANGAVLCVQTADCVPVVLISSQAVGVVHCGWRGLVAGVVRAGVDALRAEGGETIRALIGPCIRPGGYEFGRDDLESVAAVAGSTARSVTDAGAPALDMAAATIALLHAAGVTDIDDLGFDTAQDRWWSHRTRSDDGRQTTAVRLVRS